MGEKGVAVMAAGDDMGEGMQCTDHPYRTNPGGICAFCLQERLGKLVSSSKSNPNFSPLQLPPPSPSSSSPPRLTADNNRSTAAAAGRGRSQIPFLSAATKKKKKGSSTSSSNGSYNPYNGSSSSSRKVMGSSSSTTTTTSSSSSNNNNSVLVLKRSKSVAPRPLGGLSEIGSIGGDSTTDSPRKKSFWSFLYLSSSSSLSPNSSTTSAAPSKRRSISAAASGGADLKPQQQTIESIAAEEAVAESPGGSQASSSFGRKVSRSRSVGCGSRSFSGDFLERISTGFGDCTLRRVESHREAKPKAVVGVDDEEDHRRIKERVKCGGIFGGFGLISSSSSSYWISASADDFENAAARMSTSRGGGTQHGRSRNWGWASFASPMRAFRPAASASASKSYVITAVNSATATTTTTSNSKMGSNLNPALLTVGS